ncbi:NAD(P)H-quinone oxidoreductase subunit 4 [Nodularia spumigena CCY9414]|nr:NAD(P)H-quinone oxidoreductase subunit 4 [Nodularia spumigena CCY9414]
MFTAPTAIAAVDVSTQYIAFDTSTGSIDEAVASYRSLKGKVAKQQSLSIDEIKQALGVINDKINTLVQEKKDLLAADSNASTDNLDSSIASYRSLKGKVAKQQSLSIDEIKQALGVINAKINSLT